MPLYEYKCDSCGKIFEVMQKISDRPLEMHEGCGGRVERLLSPPALQFKGTGWYVTDYARGNGKSGSTEESKPASPGKPDRKETKSEFPAAASSKSESKKESK